MVNALLIIMMIVIPVIFLFSSFMFVVFFSSPVDRFQAILPKIIVILGMTFAGCAVLFLPFDVWNNIQAGGLTSATPVIWQIIFAFMAAWIVLVLPFSLIYFETFDSEKDHVKNVVSQSISAIVGTIIIFIITGLGMGISYIFFGYVQIPMTTQVSSYGAASLSSVVLNCDTCYLESSDLTTRMGIIVYITAFLCAVGWFVLVVCGGCGMSSIPITLILGCVNRPKRIKLEEFVVQQKKFALRSHNLIKAGKKIEALRKQPGGRTNMQTIRLYQEFKRAVYTADEEYQLLKTQFEKGGGSIVFYVIGLIFGVVAAVITILWIIHMILFMFTKQPIWGGLNLLFYYLDYAFPLFGLIAYSIFAFYLLMSVIAGNITIASRLPLVSLYPIKFKDTLTSSFLYNTWLLMLGCIPVIQFTANAFSSYGSVTSLSGFFNVYVTNMIYFNWFFANVHYVFFAFIFIGFALSMFFAFRPNKTKEQKIIEQIMES
ncbi:lipocalin-interacting membrane receptor [Acrasis kona]|uniref:Lipocalin-interacting membrane receptor n=1 Tax=Acrasis kona TaxID=1008807 RepID=A0AAW2YVJ3_9EUKA